MSTENTVASGPTIDSRVRVPSNVVYRTFARETVVVNLETGIYHGLNRVGGRMLEILERAPSIRVAAEKLAAEFDQPIATIETDLRAFCSDLLERGLIELR
jgi:hypothetical protein